jgi:hypothetical protein
MPTKREAELKARFTKELLRQLPSFYVLEYATTAAPDRTVIGGGVQTNWEFKHGTPHFDSPGNQELMCMRLAQAGHCRYVIWHEWKDTMLTMIVHPRAVHERESWTMPAESFCVGFDMAWLVKEVRKVHFGA